MSAAHTPGPWVILPPKPCEDDDGSFTHPGGIEADDGSQVCLFGDPCGSGTMFENEANKRLIAAAPDLLAALKCFVEDERFRVAVGGNPNVVEKMIADARGAIAKAEGRG